MRVVGAGDIARSNGQPLSGLELHRDAVFQPAGADLGPLQIAQDTDRFPFFARDLAHHFDQLELFRRVPWEKLSRATSSPARTSSRKTGSWLQEGPSVATILARRRWLRGKGITRFHQGKTHSSPILRSRRRWSDIATRSAGKRFPGDPTALRPFGHHLRETALRSPACSILRVLGRRRFRAG